MTAGSARWRWWRGAALLPLGLGCQAAGGPGTRAATAAPAAVVMPVVRAPADGSGSPVNPPGVPPVGGTLRTMHALEYVDVRVGAGDSLRPRQCAYAHYTGWLTDGTRFDSSRDTTRTGEPREPLAFPQGVRRVIPGWDAGVEGMRVGGVRRLVIPFPLAYGEAGRPPAIPARATLVFDIELLAARDTLPRPADDPGIPGAPPACTPWRDLAR
jgi:peptidylprolyl isomerase